MAELSYFWDGTTEGDATLAPYSSDEFVAILRMLSGAGSAPYKSGVFKDELNELNISIGTNLATINTGRAQIFGRHYVNTVAVNITVPSSGSSTRYDVIVVRCDWAAKTARLTRIAGVDGGSIPPITNTEGILWDLPLFTISINTSGTITVNQDNRVYVPYIADIIAGSLPTVTDIPNLVLSTYTKNLITALANLTSAPLLLLSTYTQGFITSLGNLIAAPSLNIDGLTSFKLPMRAVRNSSVQAVGAPSSEQTVQFDTVVFDSEGGGALSLNRLVAPITGMYLVSAAIGIDIGDTGGVPNGGVIKVCKNGSLLSPYVGLASGSDTIYGIGPWPYNFTRLVVGPAPVYLAAGDTVQLQFQPNDTTNSYELDATFRNSFVLQFVGYAAGGVGEIAP